MEQLSKLKPVTDRRMKILRQYYSFQTSKVYSGILSCIVVARSTQPPDEQDLKVKQLFCRRCSSDLPAVGLQS